MKIVLIIQARMNSERLPGKVLKPILGKPMLSYLIERVKQVKEVNEVVLATTVNDSDDAIADLGRKEGIAVFRGSEDDVLSRFYEAAKMCRADAVVRVTGDCPVIDPHVISQVIQCFQEKRGNVDYVSNFVKRTHPRGLDAEIFSFRALEEAFQESTSTSEREHVTPFIYHRPSRYRLASVEHSVNLSKHRWTVDTPEDFILLQNIISSLYPLNPSFTLEDIVKLIQTHPEWENLNAHVTQKAH